jgi:beta-glucosidase/6-phospho-beta-glucosidase/beta-galactosidase
MNNLFMDKIVHAMEFIGLNYYGVEKVKGLSVTLDSEVEYSDSGRGISPNGLYKLVHHFHHRYQNYNLPFFITENGVADATDQTRPAYLIEHLKVVHKLMEEGIPFLGYIHWTLTDNFEWSDGYCPKFGLVAVERDSGLRIKRDSFELFQHIIQTRTITDHDQMNAWAKNMLMKGSLRPSCRAKNAVDALDDYRYEPYQGIDWRFYD